MTEDYTLGGKSVVRLTLSQLQNIVEAVEWASNKPDSICNFELAIIDPYDFDGVSLGKIETDSLGYVTWVME
jgi:hypothetical protein